MILLSYTYIVHLYLQNKKDTTFWGSEGDDQLEKKGDNGYLFNQHCLDILYCFISNSSCDKI